MIKKEENKGQLSFLMPGFLDQLDKAHPLYKLALAIDWVYFDKEFAKYYKIDFGRPSLPIRLMVSLLILKHLRNLSDESVVEQWSENCYYQFFSGKTEFTPSKPCVPTELVAFRDRIGAEGAEKILKASIKVNGKDGDEDDIVGDTTVQEKNITYPTDSKLHQKIITKCLAIAEEQEIVLRQSYRRIVPKLRYEQRSRNHPKHAAKARKANKKIKTIAGRLVREVGRKLPPEHEYVEKLEIFKRVIAQKRSDKNKVYSLHEPHVNCISKGKDHKKYEFGSKVSIFRTKTTGVIVGALNFTENIYDGKTLDAALDQYERLTGKHPKRGFFDLGYRGPKMIGSTEIITPDKGKKMTTAYQKRKHKKDMKKRSAIEPIIGHLKEDHRLGRNYLKGIKGDQLNIMLAAAAFNFRRFMRIKLRALFALEYHALLSIIQPIEEHFFKLSCAFIPVNSKLTL